MKLITDGIFHACVHENGTAELIRYDGNATHIVVPAVIEGYPITALGDKLFWYHQECKSVSLPPHITKIGNYVFTFCNALEKLELPNALEEIGMDAFVGVPLCHIKLPESLKMVGYGAFRRTRLAEITVPDSVERINRTALDDCPFLTQIQIGSSTKAICTCHECNALKQITVSSENPYFCDIDGVLFDKAVTKLIKYPPQKNADCYEIPSTVKEIYGHAFEYAKVKRVICPDGLERINTDAFLHSALTNINIPDTVCYVETQGRFRDNEWDCFSPQVQFEISEQHKSYMVKDGKLVRKTKKTAASAPVQLEQKISGIFTYYISNHSAHITKISRCPQELVIPETLGDAPVTQFSKQLPAFFVSGCPRKIVLPKTFSKAFSGEMFASNDDLIEEIAVSPENPYFYTRDGILFRYPVEPRKSTVRPLPGEYGKKLCCCPMRFRHHDCYRIPDDVEYIGEFAFYHIHSIKQFVIPKSVKLIFRNAFRNCLDLEEIIIEEGCEAMIWECAFFCNNKLKRIVIPKSVTQLSDYAVEVYQTEPPVICCARDSAAHLYAFKVKFPVSLQ